MPICDVKCCGMRSLCNVAGFASLHCLYWVSPVLIGAVLVELAAMTHCNDTTAGSTHSARLVFKHCMSTTHKVSSLQLGLGSHAGSQDEEIVMLQQRYCLALWRLPAASSPASSASASASPSGIPSSAAPSDAPSASPPTATPATPPAAPQPVPSAAPPAASPAAASAAASGGPDAEGASHLPSGQPESSCWVREEADAVLLAFTYPRYQAYSIARSPDGRFVAVGQSPKPQTLLHES